MTYWKILFKVAPIGFITCLGEFGCQDYEKHIFDHWYLCSSLRKFSLIDLIDLKKAMSYRLHIWYIGRTFRTKLLVRIRQFVLPYVDPKTNSRNRDIFIVAMSRDFQIWYMDMYANMIIKNVWWEWSRHLRYEYLKSDI